MHPLPCSAPRESRFVKHDASRVRIGGAIFRFRNLWSVGPERSDHVLQAFHIPAKRDQRIRARVRAAYRSAYVRAARFARVGEDCARRWSDSQRALPCFYRPLESDRTLFVTRGPLPLPRTESAGRGGDGARPA